MWGVAEAMEHRRPGRPRANPATESATVTTEEQVLDAAAELFVTVGFARCTTRQIATLAGIRQATLYHYFASKDELLAVLLMSSIVPSLGVAERLRSDAGASSDPAAALYALVVADVRTLARVPHNVASLYDIPDVRDKPEFARFRSQREALTRAYEDMARALSPAVPGRLAGTVVMQIVESVIRLRAASAFQVSHEDDLARACLRALGLDDLEIAAARRNAAPILERVTV